MILYNTRTQWTNRPFSEYLRQDDFFYADWEGGTVFVIISGSFTSKTKMRSPLTWLFDSHGIHSPQCWASFCRKYNLTAMSGYLIQVLTATLSDYCHNMPISGMKCDDSCTTLVFLKVNITTVNCQILASLLSINKLDQIFWKKLINSTKINNHNVRISRLHVCIGNMVGTRETCIFCDSWLRNYTQRQR